MLVAEDLLLLLTDDATGKFATDSNRLDLGLAGACVIELARLGRVDVSGENEAVKKGRLVMRDDATTDDALLDEVLRRCAARAGAVPSKVLGKLGKDVRSQLLDRLVDRGILRRTEGRLLGLFPYSRWPAVDSAHEQQLRAQLESVLLRDAPPDPRTAALAGLLSALDAAHKVVDAPDRKAVRKRAKEIRETQWASGAVGKAVEAVESAVMVTLVAATVAASAGGAVGS
jgi:hypothetical protein